MTTGKIMKNIILFAIPIIIGNVLQQLYTTVDAIVIGKYCGDTSLAAVGTSSQPVEVLLCVFLGIGTGVSILISQYTGAKESEKVVSVCGTSITFIYIVGIPIEIYEYSNNSSSSTNKYVFYSYDNGQFNYKGEIVFYDLGIDMYDKYNRAIYIDGYIYVMSSSQFKSASAETMETIDELIF